MTKSYVAGTAWHCYGGNPSAQNTIHNAHPDKDMFFTECSGTTASPDFASNLVNTIDTLYVTVVNNWARGVLHWNIALDPNDGPHVPGGCGSCRGIVTIHPDGSYVREVEYYALGHNSKFVDVGAYRIGSSSSQSSTISVVSYQNPSGSFVAIVLNKSKSEQQFDLNWNNQYVSYSLPKQSVVTFMWSA